MDEENLITTSDQAATFSDDESSGDDRYQGSTDLPDAGSSNDAEPAASGDKPEEKVTFESLEEQLLAKIGEKPGLQAKPQVKNVPAVDGTQAAPSTGPQLFDASGKLQLKPGQPLTPQNIRELERGFLREADYTRKTQEVSRVRQEAQSVLDQVQAINQNPALLRQHFKDEQILAAFHPQDLLGFIMPRIGVQPQMWQQFLQWRNQNGEENPAGAAAYNPANQALQRINQEVTQLKTKLSTYEQREQSNLQTAEMGKVESEVNSVLGKYPSVKKRELLVAIAADESDKSIEDLAKNLASEKEARFQEYIKQKQLKQKTRVNPANGRSVPIMPRAPKTFDEAEDMLNKLDWSGTL